MSRAMYQALLEIAENGEKFPPWELNVSERMFRAIERKGYANRFGYVSLVTRKGWQAIAAR